MNGLYKDVMNMAASPGAAGTADFHESWVRSRLEITGIFSKCCYL